MELPPGTEYYEGPSPLGPFPGRSKESTKDLDRQRDRDRDRRTQHSRDSRRDRRDDETYDDESRGRHRRRDSYDDDRRRRRSYERSKDRERERDRDKDRDRVRDRDRDSYYERRDTNNWREDIPNDTIMIRGLPLSVNSADIKNEVNRCGLEPTDIRLMKKPDGGVSRGFAFVEFHLLSEAVRWKELTQGVVMFGTNRTTLHYSIPRNTADSNSDRISTIKMDWTCSKCGVINFRRRNACFICNSLREDSEIFSNTGTNDVCTTPNCTLLLGNLDMLTTEETVLRVLGNHTDLPIKSIKIPKDSISSISKGICFVELHYTVEATQLHDMLISLGDEFIIDGRQVSVTYARRSMSSLNCAAKANAATAALAAAQWTNQANYNQNHAFQNTNNKASPSVSAPPTTSASNNQTYSSTYKTPQKEFNLGTVVVNGVAYQKFPVPNMSTYQYDETSSFYYDPQTGLYYDSNSQYYYNSVTQQYLYWDADRQTYLPSSLIATSEATISAPSTVNSNNNNNSSSNDNNDDQKSKGAKVNYAKKVVKDMEKWAKTLNQKKENNKQNLMNQSYNSDGSKPSATADAGFAVLEKKGVSLADFIMRKSESSESSQSKKAIVAEYGESDSDTEDVEVEQALEAWTQEQAKLTDWVKMACLLCKRQFGNKETLVRHQQLSDLHKQNLNALKASKLTTNQLEELERRENDDEGGYRDRAKERRQKYGTEDRPQSNRLKDEYKKHLKIAQSISYEEPTKHGIGNNNIGNKMLKAMGWTEGQGLGKNNTGTADIIEVQKRVQTAGLGMRGATYNSSGSDSYREAAKKAMQARYNDIS